MSLLLKSLTRLDKLRSEAAPPQRREEALPAVKENQPLDIPSAEISAALKAIAVEIAQAEPAIVESISYDCDELTPIEPDDFLSLEDLFGAPPEWNLPPVTDATTNDMPVLDEVPMLGEVPDAESPKAADVNEGFVAPPVDVSSEPEEVDYLVLPASIVDESQPESPLDKLDQLERLLALDIAGRASVSPEQPPTVPTAVAELQPMVRATVQPELPPVEPALIEDLQPTVQEVAPSEQPPAEPEPMASTLETEPPPMASAAVAKPVPMPSAIVAEPVPIVIPLPEAPAITVPQPAVRDEYRELRDHLLARFKLKQHSTLLCVDAGRITCDASWLMPLAVSLIEHLSSQQKSAAAKKTGLPRILLVEAAGAHCEIARSMGLDVCHGLAEVLCGDVDWQAAISPTTHPQIQLLGRGMPSLKPHQRSKLTELWAEMKSHFDVLLVAAGPLTDGSSSNSAAISTSAGLFLSVADAAILCLELAGTPQLAAENARQMLASSRVNLLGCIVRG